MLKIKHIKIMVVCVLDKDKNSPLSIASVVVTPTFCVVLVVQHSKCKIYRLQFCDLSFSIILL